MTKWEIPNMVDTEYKDTFVAANGSLISILGSFYPIQSTDLITGTDCSDCGLLQSPPESKEFNS